MSRASDMELDKFMFLASASTLTVIVATTYYYIRASQKPTICTSNEKLRNFLECHVPALFEKYSPSWLFFEGRIQSIMGLALRLPESKKLPYTREIFELSDGGQLGLDWLEPEPEELSLDKNSSSNSSSNSKNSSTSNANGSSPNNRTNNGRTGNRKGRKGAAAAAGAQNNNNDDQKLLVLLLPGLTSTSQTSYVKSIALAITHSGSTVCVLNNRGLAGVELKTPRTYCASKPDDVREVIHHLKKLYPNRRLMAIGTSLGGILLCQYLINHGLEAKETLVAACVISICWDPASGSDSLEKPFVNKYIMNYNLTNSLRALAAKYRKILEERNCWDFNKVLKSRTLREFDAHFTAPQFGYDSVNDYYQDACVGSHIHKFPIPVFGINAYDDPLQPGDHLPTQEAESEGSNLAMVITQRGGHLGFLESSSPRPFHYLERLLIELVRGVRLHGEELNLY